MKRRSLFPFGPAILMHAGGWDEVLMIAGPVIIFGVLRWLGGRHRRREDEEDDPDEPLKPTGEEG
jgi:hypothetical protein